MEKGEKLGFYGCLVVMIAGFSIVVTMFIGNNSRIDNVYNRVNSLNDEITDVKSQLEIKIDGVRDEVSSSKDYLSGRIDGVLTEISKVNGRIDRIYEILVESPKQEQEGD